MVERKDKVDLYTAIDHYDDENGSFFMTFAMALNASINFDHFC